MIRRLALAALACASCAAAAAAADAPILPGYWESTDKVTSPIPSTTTRRQCITQDKIESYMTGPVNSHYTCHYTDRKMTADTFAMTGDCVDSSGIPAKVKVDGTYTATSFTMNGHMHVVIGGLSIPVTASTDAHRISAECPADAAPK